MKVAFRVDSSARIGGGHVMRCLTLADEIKRRGGENTVHRRGHAPSLAERLRARGHSLHLIAPPRRRSPSRGRRLGSRDSLSLDGSPKADAQRRAPSSEQGADWLIVDHYLLYAEWHREVRPVTERLMIIDDLANRSLDCDLLLDQTPGRTANDYAAMAPPRAALLLGASYALLRPEFALERSGGAGPTPRCGPVRRILLSLGTTDIDGVTATVLDAILPVAIDQAIDVVLGPDAESLARVRARSQRQIRASRFTSMPQNMAELMRDADLAIGAAGTTSWERCCLGLPSLIFILAANQEIDWPSRWRQKARTCWLTCPACPRRLREILDDETRRDTMGAASASIVDGLGAGRVANEITAAKRERAA